MIERIYPPPKEKQTQYRQSKQLLLKFPQNRHFLSHATATTKLSYGATVKSYVIGLALSVLIAGSALTAVVVVWQTSSELRLNFQVKLPMMHHLLFLFYRY